MTKSPIFAHGVRLADTHGLDPKRFDVVISVSRKNFAPLSLKDLEAIEATLAPLAAPAPPTKRGDPLAGTTGKTRKLVAQLNEITSDEKPRMKRAGKPAARSAAKVVRAPAKNRRAG